MLSVSDNKVDCEFKQARLEHAHPGFPALDLNCSCIWRTTSSLVSSSEGPRMRPRHQVQNAVQPQHVVLRPASALWALVGSERGQPSS